MKFADFAKRPVRKVIKEDDEYITETSKVEGADIHYFRNILTNPRHDKYTLKSYERDYTAEEREVTILALDGRKRIVITFNADFLELLQELIDLCDDLGYVTKDSNERNINTRTIMVYR